MEEKLTDEISSSQKSLPSSHDSGWNDPPKWAYTLKDSSDNTSLKRPLNKRVAFPLNGNSTISNVTHSSVSNFKVLPPTMECTMTLTTAPHAPLAVPSMIQQNLSIRQIGKEQALSDTIKNLETVINKYMESMSKRDELLKRLQIMRTMWLENKLNSDIQNKLLDISTALKNEDVINADKIHVALMMDYASLCSSWISGIRLIIQEMKKCILPSPVDTVSPSHM